jgi:putative ABC transport system permease protein
VSAIRRAWLRLVSLFRSGRADTDLAREIAAHLRLLEDGFLATGMSPEDARHAARRAFGGVEQAKERQRDARSFEWLAGWSMDFKLGVRMLIRYPGLSLVAGVAIAFAIAAGAGTFQFLTQLTYPTIPLDSGDRIVGIRLWHVSSSSVERRASFDFVRWRDEVESIEDLGAFRTIERNLSTEHGVPEPVRVAEISASAFRVARVPPLKGRFLVATDEQAGASTVIVIGYDLWHARFGGDPNVVGRTVRLGSTPGIVVGVMPKGFAFPVSHSAWTPLRFDVTGPRRGPEIQVFGRLASGATIGEAEAEMASIGMRAATTFPDTHAHLRPQVMPYAQSITGVRGLESVALLSINAFLLMFLALVGANVALLMFARALSRESEIVVRHALGATRGRIIMQLVAEALVLGSVATAVGIGASTFLLKWWLGISEIDAGERLPFWFDARVAPETVFYAACLAVFSACIAGVVPALKLTGRGVEAQLRQAAVRSDGLRFGGVWTFVIVTQVAVTVAFPATTFFVRRHVVQTQALDVGFPAAKYLAARLEMDWETAPVRATWQELKRQLASEPDVIGVTFTSRLPGTVHAERWLEVDGEAAPPQSARGHRVNTASVAVDYFDVLAVPVLRGRSFHSGDAEGAETVIVNQSFVRRVLGNRNPIGRRVRYMSGNSAETESAGSGRGSWLTIVGVVRDLGTIHDNPLDLAALYHPAATAVPMHIAVHVKGEPASFAPRFRAVAAAVDPALRLHELRPLNQVGASMWNEFDFLFRLLTLVSSIALLLSLAGIYSVMSFTVSRRTREIGIRVALGGARSHVVAAVFSRPLVQVVLGVAAGGGLVLVLTRLVTGLSAREVAIVAAYVVLMTGVCLLACIVPTRRALRIQPTRALKAE